MIRQRRSDSTCGRRDKRTPAKLVLEQSAKARFLPTLTKYESSTGSSTVITRQFAQSDTQHPGIDFIEARKVSLMHHFRPMTQHPPNKPPLVLHP
jgi:hypothetical protein